MNPVVALVAASQHGGGCFSIGQGRNLMALRRWLTSLLLWIGTAGLACATLPGSPIFSQHARVWSVEQGLSQVFVASVAQDRAGFIWIATQRGLARFDGSRFRTFDRTNTPELTTNLIHVLAADAGGQLWIGTSSGLFVHHHGRFAPILADGQPLGEVSGIAPAADVVWVVSQRGLFRIRPDGSGAAAVAAWPGGVATQVVLDAQGAPTVAGYGGVYQAAADGSGFRFQALPDPTLTVQSMAWRNGVLWVGSNHGLWKLDAGGFRIAVPELRDANVSALLEVSGSGLWIGTASGLRFLDAQGELLDFSRKTELRDLWIQSLLIDRAGDLWVGTAANGLVRLWARPLAWFDRSAGFTDPLITTVFEDRDGSVLIGSKTGAYRFEQEQLQAWLTAAELPDPFVTAFLRWPDGDLWVGTMGGLSARRDGRSVPLPPSLEPLAHAKIISLLAEPDGDAWIATANGLYGWQQDRLRHFDQSSGLDGAYVHFVHRAADGVLRAGTTHGLFEWRDGRFQSLCRDQGLDGPALHLSEDGAGGLWVSTPINGLFEVSGGRCRQPRVAGDITSEGAYVALPDGKGHLWISNDAGIFQLSLADLNHPGRNPAAAPARRIIQSHDGLHGIHPVGGSAQSGLIDRQGRLWIPAVDGLLVLDAAAPPSANDAPLVVESISRGEQRIDLVDRSDAVRFTPGNHDLRIHFARLDYREPERTRFQYRLSGYDQGWIDAGDRQEASYTHLPPGSFRFEVRVADPGEAGASTPAGFDFHLQPYFYQTIWFRALLGVLATALLWGMHRLRLHRLQSRKNALEALVAVRTTALQQANQELYRASRTDPLTGLANRRHFTESIGARVESLIRTARHGGPAESLWFLMLDLDHFKQINDRHGHRSGDLILKQLSALLADQFPAFDSVIRWGGEEFLVVVNMAADAPIEPVVEHLRASVARHAFAVDKGPDIRCTLSIGACAYPFAPNAFERPSFEEIINLADAALYLAKRCGRNTWIGVGAGADARNADWSQQVIRLPDLLQGGLARLLGPHARGDDADLDLATRNDVSEVQELVIGPPFQSREAEHRPSPSPAARAMVPPG